MHQSIGKYKHNHPCCKKVFKKIKIIPWLQQSIIKDRTNPLKRYGGIKLQNVVIRSADFQCLQFQLLIHFWKDQSPKFHKKIIER